LFYGDIQLISMVMADELQLSAKRYSKKRATIDTMKFFWRRRQSAIVGQPRILPTL
jgi:hypothetical protein